MKHDSPVVQQKTPTTTPSSSPATIKPVRKAPPPPILGNKTPQASTHGASGDHKQVLSPATVTEVKPIVTSASETQLHQQQEQKQQQQQQQHGRIQHQSPQEEDRIQTQPPLLQQQQQQQPITVKHLSKSSSCGEIVKSQGRRVPPPPPVRDSSLSNEPYDEQSDDKGSTGQEPRQGRVSKPVPKRRTKSVHH